MEISPVISVTLKSLEKNGFKCQLAGTGLEARDMVLEMVPTEANVSIADSATLRQIGLLDELVRRDYKVNNPFRPEMTQGIHESPEKLQRFVAALRRTFTSDVLISSSNAVTEDGNLVNIDGAGNRVAGIIYGAPRVILVVGRNKIVKNSNEAIKRIKNVIAPAHTAQKRYNTPCAKTGKCSDCDNPRRICNITVIMEKKPYHTDISVVLVNEDVGLGWDPGWDRERIENIRANYIKHSWPF